MLVEPGRGAHPLAVQVRDAGRRRVAADEDLLARVEVLRRERDLLPAFAVDGHHVGDDVDRAVDQRRDPLRVREHLVLDPVRVAEDRAGDLADQVDVEAFEVAR